MTKKSCTNCQNFDIDDDRCTLHNIPVPWDDHEMFAEKCEDFQIFEKEVIITDDGEDEPYLHAGRYESWFYDEHFGHCIMTRFPWTGKVKITIERVTE